MLRTTIGENDIASLAKTITSETIIITIYYYNIIHNLLYTIAVVVLVYMRKRTELRKNHCRLLVGVRMYLKWA